MSVLQNLTNRVLGRKTCEDGLSVWMDPVEFSQVTAVVESVAPRRVLEWGAGGSTRALLEMCPFIERYVSIEHDPGWYELVKSQVNDPRLELYLEEVTVPQPVLNGSKKRWKQARGQWQKRLEREPEITASYVAKPATLNTEFDFILVDGRGRVFCLTEGFRMLRPGGVIMLHDAQRPEYREALESLGRVVWLQQWDNGQICFVRKPGAGEQDALAERSA